MDYLIRNFMIFSISELNQIDFNQVLETSQYTIRKSTNKLKTFVKWDGDVIPECIKTLTTSEGPYTYDEMINILETPEWMEYAPINVP
jgi:hypothetical protein